MSIDLVLPHAYSPTAGAFTSQLPVPTTNSRQNRFGNTTPVGEVTKTAPVSFTRIPDAVMLDPRLTPVQFRIYAVIARRADRESATAFPSYATIAKDANISRRSAINGIAELVSFGYLAKRSQQSGQGDLTSNRYTISGEGSEIFAPRGAPSPEVVQTLHHGSAANEPQVVQTLHHGSANAAPELDSKNQMQKNKTQENRIAPAHTHEASAAAAVPELQTLFIDFQENIGALTTVAKEVISRLAEEHSVGRVRDAIQEAVIYEKRSLAYIRRVLGAWKRDGRVAERSGIPWTNPSSLVGPQILEQSAQPDMVWPPPDLDDDLPATVSDNNDPAVAAWNAISHLLPQLGKLRRLITPHSLIDNVLTVTVSDSRTYSVLTHGQRFFVACATERVLGSEASIRVEMVAQESGVERVTGQP